MLLTEPYVIQAEAWPKSGRHILAQADTLSVIVYQAYSHAIGSYALNHGYFGSGFDYARMSWIKPNFLWMMYRSGWGTKPGQELTLAIRLRRKFFDELLAQAVESSYTGHQYPTREEWQRAARASSVRLQWDPDHHPAGASLKRRALQLGLRGESLEKYGRDEILEIVDLSPFVVEQRQNTIKERIPQLLTPLERVYLPENEAARIKIGLD